MKKEGNIWYILKLSLKPKLWFVLFIPVCTILIGQKSVALSWLVAQIFNNLQMIVGGNREVSYLQKAIVCAVLIFGLDIAQWLLSTLSSLIENFWREYIGVEMQNLFMYKDYKCDIADFDDPNLISRRTLAKNVDPVSVIKSLINFCSTVFVIATYSIMLWKVSPIMVFVAAAIKLPTFYFYDKTMKLNRKFKIESGAISREKGYYYGIPVDKSYVKEYKIYSMKDYVCKKFDVVTSKFLSFYKRSFGKIALNNTILGIYDELVTLIVRITLGISVFSGKILFGDFTLCVAAFISLSSSVEKIVDFVSQFKETNEQINMLKEYLYGKNIFESGESASCKVSGAIHSIELVNVSFSYPGTNTEVFCGLNMKFYASKTYGIVGLNGCGKSTLVNLLLRLYEPTNGKILLDGKDIREYDIHSYYEAVSCVFQNTTHYAMPIKNYVASGRFLDLGKVEDAIRMVDLDTWCKDLPHGLDTMLSREFESENNSVEPSGGQWQKLAIARAIYKDSNIMILDEPSASLDVDAENEIFHYIKNFSKNKISILISHRLSNITECDQIYLLQDGKVAESGTHYELLEKKGNYERLFASQAKFYT